MKNQSTALYVPMLVSVMILAGGCVGSPDLLDDPAFDEIVGETRLASQAGEPDDRDGGGFGSEPRCMPVMPIGNGGGTACPQNDCGTNNPEVNKYPVPELYLEYGVPNAAGVSMVGFLDPSGAPATLVAEHGRLRAITGTGKILEGDGLKYSKILIERAGVSDVIVIYGYDREESWVTGSGEQIHKYLFTYADDESGVVPSDDPCEFRLPVCRAYQEGADEALAWATIITDERYQLDADHRVLPSVFQSPAPLWFNIACQGNSLFKARKWEYYPDTGNPAITTTVADREALNRAIINDACGMDLGFTENGTTVGWRNVSGSVDIPMAWNFDDLEVESIWDENGAICLTKSRLEDAELEIADNCPALLATPCPDVNEAVSNLAAYGKIVTLVPQNP